MGLPESRIVRACPTGHDNLHRDLRAALRDQPYRAGGVSQDLITEAVEFYDAHPEVHDQLWTLADELVEEPPQREASPTGAANFPEKRPNVPRYGPPTNAEVRVERGDLPREAISHSRKEEGTHNTNSLEIARQSSAHINRPLTREEKRARSALGWVIRQEEENHG